MNNDTDAVQSEIQPAPVTTPNIEISDKDKENFFKSFLADKPYEEEISLFDNKIKLKVRSLLVEESSDIIRQIESDKEKGIAKNDNSYFIRISAYRLGLALLEMDNAPYLPKVTKELFPFDSKDTDSYVLERAKPLLKMTDFKLAILTEAHRKFEQKLFTLTTQVINKNF